MKAGKLAKPSVATAIPPTLTETKNVTQCTASIAPDSSSARQREATPTPAPRFTPATRLNTASVITANSDRPHVMMVASAWINSPRMPQVPKQMATRWMARSDCERLINLQRIEN